MSLTELRHRIACLAADERGFSALEYSLITVIIGTFIIGCVQVLGGALTSSYDTIGNALQTIASSH